MNDPPLELQSIMLMETGNDNSLEPGELSGSGGSTPKLENTVKDIKCSPSEQIRNSYKEGIIQHPKIYQPNISQSMYRASFGQHYRGAPRMRGNTHWNRGGFMHPRMNKNMGYRNPMNREMGNERNLDYSYKNQRQTNNKLRHTRTKPSLSWQVNLNIKIPLNSSDIQTTKNESDTILPNKSKLQKTSSSPMKKTEILNQEPRNKNYVNKMVDAKIESTSSKMKKKKSSSTTRKSIESDEKQNLKLKKNKANKSKNDSKKSSKKKDNNKLKISDIDGVKNLKVKEKSDNIKIEEPKTPEIQKTLEIKGTPEIQKQPDISKYEESTTPPPKLVENKDKSATEKLNTGKDHKKKKEASKPKCDFRLSFVDDLEDDDIEVPSINEDIDIFPLTKDETICAIDSKKQEKKLKKQENEKCDDESSPDTDDYQDMWEEDIDLPINKDSPLDKKHEISKSKSKQHKMTKDSETINISFKIPQIQSEVNLDKCLKSKNTDNEIDKKNEVVKAEKTEDLFKHITESSFENSSKLRVKDNLVKEEKVSLSYELTSDLLDLKPKIKQINIGLNKNEVIKQEKLTNKNSSLNFDSNQNKEPSLYSPDKKSLKRSSSSSSTSSSSSNSTTSSSSSSCYSSEDEQNNLSKSEIRDGLGTPIFVNPSPPRNLEDIPSIVESNTPPLTSPIKQDVAEESTRELTPKVILKNKEIIKEDLLPEVNPTKQKKLLFGMQDIYEQFIQSVNNAGIDLSIDQKNSNEKNSEKSSAVISQSTTDVKQEQGNQSGKMKEAPSIKSELKKSVYIETPKVSKDSTEKISYFTPIAIKPPLKTGKSPFEASSSDTDSITDSDTDSDSDSSSDSSSSSAVSEDEVLTLEDKKKLRALEKRLNTLKTWTAADEDEKKCFEGLQKLIQNEVNLVKCKYEEKEVNKTSFKIISKPVIQRLPPQPVVRIVPKIPAVLQQIPMQLPSEKLLSQRDVPKIIVPPNILGGFTMPIAQIFSIEKEMSKAELQNDKNKIAEKDARYAKEKDNRDSKESSKSRRRSVERNSSRRRTPTQRRSSPQHTKQKKIHSSSPSRSSKSTKKPYGSRAYKSDKRSRSRTRSLSSSKRFRSNRTERKPSSPSLRDRIRSKSPISPRNFKRRSLSPPQEYRGTGTPTNRHSISPSRRRSISPRRQSISPRRRSVSPRRRSVSPRRRSVSPRRRSVSPRRRSVSPRRRSVSPRRRSVSPRRRNISPRRYSRSPVPFRPPSPPSPSPMQRDLSRSPIQYRTCSPYARRFDSRSRSISPEYNPHKNNRTSSPRWNDEISNHFYPEGYQYIMSPRQDSAYQSYNPQFNSYSDYMPTLAETAYSSYDLQYSQTSDYSSCSSFENQSYYYSEYQIPNDPIMQTHQLDQLSQISSNLRDRPVVKENSTVAVQKGNVLEIVPTMTVPQTDEIKLSLEKAKNEEQEAKKMYLWKEEVNRRHVLSAVLKLNRESEGGVLKSILYKTSKECKAKDKKKVLFADGIEPGNGPTDEQAVYVKTEKKKSRKKKNVLPPILQDDKENLEVVDPELENLEPPPPPPGSPPPHLTQPTLIRPPSPDLILYFHYDPVVNSMYVSQLENAIPPRLLQRPITQKNPQIDKNIVQSVNVQNARKHDKLNITSEKLIPSIPTDKPYNVPPNVVGNFQHQPRFITNPAPGLHQRLGHFPVVPNFFNAPPPNQYQHTNNIVLNRVPNYITAGVQSIATSPIIKSDSTPVFSSDSISSSSSSFFSKKDINTATPALPGAVQKCLRNELKLCSPIGSPTSSSSSSPKIGTSPTLITSSPKIRTSPTLILSSPNAIASKLNFSNLTKIKIESTPELIEQNISEENLLDEINLKSKNSEIVNKEKELFNLSITENEMLKL